MNSLGPFRNNLAETVFATKYRHENAETWNQLATTLVDSVCSNYLPDDTKDAIKGKISSMKFIPGGRYLYYAGRRKKFYNNCYLLRALEDTREDWASLSQRCESCLMTGGGIGVDYSVYRQSGVRLQGTGGIASGPIPKMMMINDIGRYVMQGGSRRSAIYASLNWKHPDVHDFMKMKNWDDMKIGDTSYGELKRTNFNFPCPLDMTNVSVNYDTDWLTHYYKTGDYGETFLENCKQALTTAEPGFSFNFFDKENETLRNACTEVVSEDDSDVCNLGSINLSKVEDLDDFKETIELATIFLMCGNLCAELPYPKVYVVRSKNQRIGLGIMGLHEWLLKRNYNYEVTPELHQWLQTYKGTSDDTAKKWANTFSINEPKGKRAIAPTGTIGILAGTTTGIEPIFAVAYKRRYLKAKEWHYQYVIDSTAEEIIRSGVSPSKIDTALDLDYRSRIKFQAKIQPYVDMAISSTINLPSPESDDSPNPEEFAGALAEFADRLRGMTCYPAGTRGGQPLTRVPYQEAIKNPGIEFKEHSEMSCKDGVCGT